MTGINARCGLHAWALEIMLPAPLLTPIGSSLPESPVVAELFALIPVFFAALMAARALAQAGFNPIRLKGRQLTGGTLC